MLDNVELLSRVQFALTAGFHYLYPPFSIGLAWLLVLMKAQHLRTGEAVYDQMMRFWTGIFAATFAMGVTTGIVMEFEFGTNWAAYSRFVGDVFGSPLAAEAIFAFFLESTFLGVLLFGWNRVSPRVHFISTLLVAIGATLSSVWIVVANSWQQTPAGYVLVGEGAARHAEITDFWAMVFNPSSMARLAHVVTGAVVTAAFVLMAVSAWYLLRNQHLDMAQRGLRIGLGFGFIFSVLVAVAGHHQGQLLAETQPAKLAAFEGNFKTSDGGAMLYMFGIPDAEAERVKFGVGIPGGLSFLAYNSFTHPVKALDQFPKEDQPPVLIPFFSFHLMVMMGMAMLGLTALGLFFGWKGILLEQRWLLALYVVAFPLPYLANEIGWIAAEVGRQPWIVQGMLRTKDAISESVSASQVLGSTVMFTGLYATLFLLYAVVVVKKVLHGPDEAAE